MADSDLSNIWTATTPLPSPHMLKERILVTPAQRKFHEDARQQLGRILDGICPRMVMIVGPCSIHDITAAHEYATKLKRLSERVADTMMIVMRVYFEKPRTALGWRGMLYDPTLDGTNDVSRGLLLTRQLLADISRLELPTATEFLSATTPQYLGDLITWACIGARTVASQPHRQLASGLPMPVGLKNSCDGNIDLAVNAIITAREPHHFIGIDNHGSTCMVETSGNPYAHLVLRGGKHGPNYHAEAIDNARHSLEAANIPPRIFVDCSHDNCGKLHDRQVAVFHDVIEQAAEGNDAITGLLLESNLFAGNQSLAQPIEKLQYAVSLTDPCLGWETTEELIRWAHTRLSRVRTNRSVHSIPNRPLKC